MTPMSPLALIQRSMKRKQRLVDAQYLMAVDHSRDQAVAACRASAGRQHDHSYDAIRENWL